MNRLASIESLWQFTEMISSMTGFGIATVKNKKMSITVQIKSVNGRFFELKTRIPRFYQSFETQMRGIIHQKLLRGTVDVSVNRSIIPDSSENSVEVLPNLALARGWVMASHKLATELGIAFRPTIESLQKIPDIFQISEPTEMDGEEKELVLKALKMAVEGCATERGREGEVLKGVLIDLLRGLDSFILGVEKKKKALDENLKKNLHKKIKNLAVDYELDNQRLNQEALYLLERADISEEISRLKCHLVGFEKHLDGKGSQGKRLDFIVQEMHREINTMGAKTQVLDVVVDVIEAKALVEKIREQVQNIE